MHKVVFITGISSGFGKCIAEILSQKGDVVYGTSRTTIEVSDTINILKADVTDVESVKAAVGKILEKEGRIDVLVNSTRIKNRHPDQKFRWRSFL